MIPHDLGDHLGCYGHAAVNSPNLDALAARGVRFSNCFASCPECSPSRGGLWTGLYPHQNGLMGLANFGWGLRAEHLAARMRAAGYATHLFGVQHETHGPVEELGYESHHSREDISAAAVCGELAEFLEGEASSPAPDRSWFACAGFREVHRPWPAAPEVDPAGVEVPAFLPDNPAIRADLAMLGRNVEELDAAVGRVFEILERGGAGENTLVIFTTDHGIGFPRAKATLYDPGLRVALLMHQPGAVDGGRVFDALACNLDVMPTICELCGLAVPAGVEGRSLLPLIRGEKSGHRDAVHGSLFYDVAYDPAHSVRTATHKYVRSFAVTPGDAAGADPEVLAAHAGGQWVRLDDFDVLSSAAWRSMKLRPDPPPREELYDLRADPHELRDLAGESSAAGTLAEMRGLLEDWMRRTRSPLLGGHVPPPERQRQASREYGYGGPMYDRECGSC
jgi:arylsulfatase A-like enzyme